MTRNKNGRGPQTLAKRATPPTWSRLWRLSIVLLLGAASFAAIAISGVNFLGSRLEWFDRAQNLNYALEPLSTDSFPSASFGAVSITVQGDRTNSILEIHQTIIMAANKFDPARDQMRIVLDTPIQGVWPGDESSWHVTRKSPVVNGNSTTNVTVAATFRAHASYASQDARSRETYVLPGHFFKPKEIYSSPEPLTWSDDSDGEYFVIAKIALPAPSASWNGIGSETLQYSWDTALKSNTQEDRKKGLEVGLNLCPCLNAVPVSAGIKRVGSNELQDVWNYTDGHTTAFEVHDRFLQAISDLALGSLFVVIPALITFGTYYVRWRQAFKIRPKPRGA